MIEKIQMLMKIYQMSAADLAERMGTERSGISHFLSGRNKPSLAFVTKMLEKFPEINPDWLLMNKGAMLREGYSNVKQHDSQKDSVKEIPFLIDEEQKSVEYQNIKAEAKIPETETHIYTEDLIKTSEQQHQNLPTQEVEPNISNTTLADKQILMSDDNSEARIVFFYHDGTYSEYVKRKP